MRCGPRLGSPACVKNVLNSCAALSNPAECRAPEIIKSAAGARCRCPGLARDMLCAMCASLAGAAGRVAAAVACSQGWPQGLRVWILEACCCTETAPRFALSVVVWLRWARDPDSVTRSCVRGGEEHGVCMYV